MENASLMAFHVCFIIIIEALDEREKKRRCFPTRSYSLKAKLSPLNHFKSR